MCQVFLSLSLIDVRMTGVVWQSGSLHAPGWWERQFIVDLFDMILSFLLGLSKFVMR